MPAIKKPSIPTTPGTPWGDTYKFLDALRQRVEYLDQLVETLSAEVALTHKNNVPQVYDNGIKTTGVFTPVVARGYLQYVFNNGAHTLRPPTQNCSIVLLYKNYASAGTITTSAFNRVTGTPTTTNNHEFFYRITVINGFSLLEILPLQ